MLGPQLIPYHEVLNQWLPKAEFRGVPKAAQFDATITWKAPRGPIHYLVEEKRHLRQQDVKLVVEQLKQRQGELPAAQQAKVLLLAPYVRQQQAAVLQAAGIDYIDLAGNAHLKGPGVFVHVEGRRPPDSPKARPGRVNKGWVKTVLALLVRPDLAAMPYRVVAEQADVALGTVAGCMNDLLVRGLLMESGRDRRLIDRQQLLTLWVQGYVDVLRPKLQERRFQVRASDKSGVWDRLENVLGRHDVRWALTGADAAETRTHFFRAEETEIYAPIGSFDDRALQKGLVAQPAARTGNLLVIDPPGPVALNATADARLPVAPDLLAYSELRYRGTPQALEAAEILLPRLLG